MPRVIDYFVEGQDQYLVMDFVPGETLDEILEKEGPQPLERMLAWARPCSPRSTCSTPTFRCMCRQLKR
jgi:serine/threonine protein kinase